MTGIKNVKTFITSVHDSAESEWTLQWDKLTVISDLWPWAVVFFWCSWDACRGFYARVYAIACPSVCLSVCLSDRWIIEKRLRLGLWNFHHTVAPSL